MKLNKEAILQAMKKQGHKPCLVELSKQIGTSYMTVTKWNKALPKNVEVFTKLQEVTKLTTKELLK
jgi:hypothetical protein